MKPFVYFLLFLFSLNILHAQTMRERKHVKQPESVDLLLKAYRQQNENKGIQGFRVQIYTASGNRSKLLTEREQANFDSSYPGVRSYIQYDEPYFKLRVGDFRTRLDAQNFMRQISSKYIYAIVVTDRINFPRLDSSDTSDRDRGVLE